MTGEAEKADEAELPPSPPPIPHQNYGDAAYWDERYAREPVCFDWYRGYDGLASVLLRHLDPAAPLLHVGMGTSQLQRDLVERAGFKRVVNVDVSGVAVAWMRGLHDGVKGLEYRVGDVRSMPEFKDGEFGGALDKGTLDALLCGAGAARSAAAALRECARVVRPSGAFILVTYGDPESRLPYLMGDDSPDWAVHVYVLAKPTAAEEAAAAATAKAKAGGAAASGGDSGSGDGGGGGGGGGTDAKPAPKQQQQQQQQAVVARGPYDAADAAAVAGLNGLRDVHYAYVCTRRRRPLGDGEGAGAGAETAAAAAAAGAGSTAAADGGGGGERGEEAPSV